MPTPDFFAFNETAFRELGAAEALPAIEERLGFPIVVKPGEPGLGARDQVRAPTPSDVPAALVAAFSYDTGCCSSATWTGATWRSRSLGRRARCRSSRRCPRDEDFYDFEARYEIGRTDFVCPAELPDEVAGRGAGAGASPPTGCSAAAASRAWT